MKYRILVPRSLDVNAINPQTLNALAMLQRWNDNGLTIDSFFCNTPDPIVAKKQHVSLHKLWRWRFWRTHIFCRCQLDYDAIFYAGSDMADVHGLRMRDLCKRPTKVIMLLEGLKGNPERERLYSAWAGHPVFCQYAEDYYIHWTDWLVNRADIVIAISPFIGKLASRYYGESVAGKLKVLPLGVDLGIFQAGERSTPLRPRVVGVGRLCDNKRPEVFLRLAKRFPDVDFIWYGWGELQQSLLTETEKHGLSNLAFPGSVSPAQLAKAFSSANLFILPSRSEGAPKVTQEASVSGLPVICFGFYETPHVIDGENGFVVWDDEQLFSRAEQLLNDPVLAESLGKRGAEMARNWDWDIVAQQWLDVVNSTVNH
jgi:glycosyltransferase involved in cell wall biosynthesis